MNLRIFTYRNPSDLAPYLADRAGDPGRVFLAPSNRDRPLMLDMLVDSSDGEGDFWGNRKGERQVWIWDDLYRALLGACGDVKPRAQIDPPDHWLLLRGIVKSLREGHREGLPPGVFAASFMDLAGEAVRELLREEVSPDDLAASLGCTGPSSEETWADPGDESAILWRVYRDYVALLEERHLADSAQIPTLAAELLRTSLKAREWAGALSMTAVGFLSFASGQLNLLRELINAGASLEFFVPRCGTGNFYTVLDQFSEVQAEFLEDKGPTLGLSLEGGDLRLASDTLARELLLWSEDKGDLAKRAAMAFPGWSAIGVCGGPDDLASAAESFVRYGLPFFHREGAMVSDTILWKSALRALDLSAEKWPPRETADFLSGLLFAPQDFRREAFRETLPAGRGEWLSFLKRDGGGPLEAFERALAFADAVQRGGPPEDLLSALQHLAPGREGMKRLVLGTGENFSLDETLRQVNGALLEAREKERALRDLARDLGPSGRAPLRGEEAMAFLTRWAETAFTRLSPPLSPAISLHPDTPPALTAAPVWIFLGTGGARWPGQVRESPLLDDHRRAALHDSLNLGRSHLPLRPEKRSQREALFRRLAACGENFCIFVRPLADGGGRPLVPSPFHPSLFEGPSPWMKSAGPPIIRPLGDIIRAEDEPLVKGVEAPSMAGPLRGVNRGDPGEISLPLLEKVFHLSALDDFAACPFFYYCRRLGLEPQKEDLFRPDKAGNGYHRLWELVWRKYSPGKESLEGLAVALFDEAYGEKYPDLLRNPALRRQKEDQFAKNRRLGALQDNLEAGGLAQDRARQKLEVPLPDLEMGGAIFRGRCDRMDTLADGYLLLFDYKSGKADRYKKMLQLAAYSAVLKKTMGAETAATVYLCLGDGDLAKAGSDSAPHWLGLRKEVLPAMEEEALEVMAGAAGSLGSGRFPPNYDSDQCKYCTFQALCRRRDHRVEPAEEEEEN